MEYKLMLANCIILFDSQRPLRIEEEWQHFLTHADAEPELEIRISWDWEQAKKPKGQRMGQNLLQSYYYGEDGWFCVSEESKHGILTSVSYEANLKNMVCTIREAPFLSAPDSIGRVMRALPLREILLQFQTVLLHASQVLCKEKGIIFTAPSGTGKTTQAHLWEQYKAAEIICNDRVLIRKCSEQYQTYGFPLDGSEPVHKNKSGELGAIVLLEQGKENHIRRLSVSSAISRLMEQTVLDEWNAASRERTLLFLMDMVTAVPVYSLTCTSDVRAVEILWEQLKFEGVI